MKRLKLKKYILYAFLGLLFFAPGLLSLTFYMMSDNVSVNNRDIALEIVDKDGNVFTFENTDDMSVLFQDIVGDSKKTLYKDGLGNFTEEDAYKITLVQNGKKACYDFFFDRTSPSTCLFRDEAGKVYLLKAARAIEFMDSIYAASLYPHSSVPTLTLNNTPAVPYESEWKYYSYSSVRHTVDDKTSDKPIDVSLSFLDFDMSFEKSPDSLCIEITDTLGIKFFSGSYADFVMQGMFSGITESNSYVCTVSAIWNDIGSDCCGSATYRFNLSVDFDPPGIFWLNAESVECGGFVILSGKNIINKDSVEVVTVPSLNYEPIFFEDGEYIRALLPIDIKNGKDEIIYQIKVNYDGTSTDLVLKTTPSKASTRVRSFGAGKIDISLRKGSAFSDFVKFVTSGKYEQTVYRSSQFVPPDPNVIRATFGDTVKNTNSNSDNFTSGGMAFVAYSSTKIQACMNGMVVKVGETAYGGNTIVVDHGLGLRSVYYCVKNTLVAEGTIVNAGDVIATGCGKGFTDGITAYIELWVGSVPVSYRPISEEGMLFGVDFGKEPSIVDKK